MFVNAIVDFPKPLISELLTEISVSPKSALFVVPLVIWIGFDGTIPFSKTTHLGILNTLLFVVLTETTKFVPCFARTVYRTL